MSQNDFNIANQGFPSFRSDLNGALQALASNSAGTSAPATTYAYMWWYDSTNDILKMRNADNDAWIDLASFDQATDTWSFASVVIDGDLAVDTNTLFVDSTNNRVGVGTSSPLATIDARGIIRGYQFLPFTDTDSAAVPSIAMANDPDTGFFRPASNVIGASTGGTERMRIDASGNVLVGKTGAGTATVGVEALANGEMNATVSGGRVGLFNRLSSDGDIVQFRKDGTVVGGIGNNSSTNGLEIYSPVGGGIAFYTRGIAPTNGTGGYVDNSKDVGSSTVRWDDVYATNGTIQTSDANEKQQIAELTAAEMQAAKAISKLFKTFKWNNSVAEKGDDARIHSGVIAQEVEAAMADAGLDAGKYAFFISTTWWESTEVIPAVEAVEAVEATYDEEGNILTEAVEAMEAQPERTVTHTHEAAEEAPEGAVERNRKGIRYPQLLSFIGAATEQRLASIEARLDAAGL